MDYIKSKEDFGLVSPLHDLSLTLQADHIVLPDNFKEIPERHWGSRFYRDITIKTYKQGEYVCIFKLLDLVVYIYELIH